MTATPRTPRPRLTDDEKAERLRSQLKMIEDRKASIRHERACEALNLIESIGEPSLMGISERLRTWIAATEPTT